MTGADDESGDRLDTLGMFDAAAALPEQIDTAVEGAQALVGLPDGDDIDNVLVLGMGGSGVAGDLLAVTAGPFMPVPVVVVKGYEPPSYVNERTLVFAMSFSGDTEETVDAATTAAMAGGRLVAVTRGGQLGELTDSSGGLVAPIADGIPQPRAGLGALVDADVDRAGAHGPVPRGRLVAGAMPPSSCGSAATSW